MKSVNDGLATLLLFASASFMDTRASRSIDDHLRNG